METAQIWTPDRRLRVHPVRSGTRRFRPAVLAATLAVAFICVGMLELRRERRLLVPHRRRRRDRGGGGGQRPHVAPGVHRGREPDGGPAGRVRQRRRHLELQRDCDTGGPAGAGHDQPGVLVRPARVDDHHDQPGRHCRPRRRTAARTQRLRTHAPRSRGRGDRAARPARRRRRTRSVRDGRPLARRRPQRPVRAHLPRGGGRPRRRGLPAAAGPGPGRRREVGRRCASSASIRRPCPATSSRPTTPASSSTRSRRPARSPTSR